MLAAPYGVLAIPHSHGNSRELEVLSGGYHFTLIKVGNTKNGDSRKLQPLYVGLFFCCSLLYLYGNLVKLNLIIFMASFTEKLNDDSIAT